MKKARALYAGFGVLATLAGMATGHFVASLLNPDSSPVLAVGSGVIDRTPTPLKEWAIRHFGSNDKTVLIGSVMVGVFILAAVAGLLARKRLWWGEAMLVVLVAVAAGAVIDRPLFEAEDLIPAALTAVAGVAALWWLDHAYRRSSRRTAEAGADPGEARGGSRRSLLVAAGVTGLAAIVLGGAGRQINKIKSKPEDITLPKPASPAPAIPAGFDDTVPGITPLQVSNADFYRVDTRLDVPVLSSSSYTLTVDGDVKNELELSFDDLLSMPLIERNITLTCVSNSVGGKYVGGATWLGVPLKNVLDMAGVGTSSDQILSTDFDGMTISTPLDIALDGRDAMLAVGMNGVALPREHGFPVRMIVPGLYGFISGTKWVTRLTLTTYAAQQSYWTQRKWDTKAPIKPSARIDTPQALARLKTGENVVGGVAWAQFDDGVKKVQVQVDNGDWVDATMGPDVNNVYWRQWFYKWNADSGSHTVAARVVDGKGQVQTADRAEPFPGGSSGIHSVLVNVA